MRSFLLLGLHTLAHILLRVLEDVAVDAHQLGAVATIDVAVVHSEVAVHHLPNDHLIALDHRLLGHCVRCEEETAVGEAGEGRSDVFEVERA